MKFFSKNIVSSFFKRALFSMLFISLFSSVSVYYFQQYTFYTSLADEIQKNLDIGMKKYNKDLKLSSQNMLNEDVELFMKELGFIITEIYDKQGGEFYTFYPSGDMFEDKIEILKEYDKYMEHVFPSSGGMNYNFFEPSDNQYFLQILYPIYKSDLLIGYIEGITYVDTVVVERFKSGIIITIVTVISTIFLFSLLIFPIIYFAYGKLNKNRIKLLSNNIMAIHTLGNAVALRDSDTDEHNYRVTLNSIKLAEEINLVQDEMKKLIIGAFLHDIGKIGITDNVLLKNGKLDEDEFNIMKEHVLKGIDLIKGNRWLENSKDVILYHHEKYDGTGYPNKIKGTDIPLIARVFSIVDVFDALTSERPYKEAFSYEKSVNILEENSGTHFDSYLLKKFIKISAEVYENTNTKSKDQLKIELNTMIEKYFLD